MNVNQTVFTNNFLYFPLPTLREEGREESFAIPPLGLYVMPARLATLSSLVRPS